MYREDRHHDVRRERLCDVYFFVCSPTATPQRVGSAAAHSRRDGGAGAGGSNRAVAVPDRDGLQRPDRKAPGASRAVQRRAVRLAAFPLVRLRAGIADRLEAFIDTPSSVAESLLGGAELNPTTHLGYGLVYLLHANRRSELSGDIAAVPQLSQFATSGGQEKYRLDLSSGYLAMPRITLRAAVGVETRHDAGFGTVQPRSILGTDITPTRSTRLALDVGTHLGSRSGVAQSFGDAALIWRAQRSVSLAVGLGTTFNASGGTKPHYFSTGVTLRP